MSNPEVFERTDEENKRCIEIHDASRAELLKRQLSNSESYDKAILSLSSAALALSLTAIKFVVPLNLATNLWAIQISWVLFLVTVICSLSAYLIGNGALNKQISIEEDYYIKGLVKAQTEKNWLSIVNSKLNVFTGIVFVVAISLVIFFVIVNINGEENMSDKKTTSKKVFLTDSAQVPKMQIAPGNTDNATASADVPSMQLAPGSKPVEQTAKPAGGNDSQSKGSSKK